MSLKNLVLANRSYRRFDEKTPVPLSVLENLVSLARLCPCAGNRQVLRFVLSANAQDNARIFSCLKWAAYLTEWSGPAEGERPSAYIVILNTEKSWEYARQDQGIVAQTMLLGAVENGLGGCILAAVDRDKLRTVLDLDAEHEICMVLALGKPVEDVRIVDLPADGSIKYYRDQDAVHYVPKRRAEELILQKRA